MAENTLSVRVDEETISLFKGLSEKSNVKNKGELLSQIISQYALQKTKEDVPIVESATTAIQNLTKQINDVLIGVGVSVTTMQNQYKQEIEEIYISNEKTISQLQQRISSLEKESTQDEERIQIFINDKEEAENKANELMRQNEQLNNSFSDKTALIDEYRQKNEALNRFVSENADLSEEKEKLDQIVSKMQHDNDTYLHQIEILKSQISELDKIQTEKLNQQKIILNLDKQQEILKLKQETQKLLEEQQKAHMKIVSEYESKVQELLVRLSIKSEIKT